MGFLSRWFSPEKSETADLDLQSRIALLEEKYNRVFADYETTFHNLQISEEELKTEREERRKDQLRHHREIIRLVDKVLISKGQSPISKQVEDDLGFVNPIAPPLTPEQVFEMNAYVQDCLRHDAKQDVVTLQNRWKQLNRIPI